jgi:putative transposase
MRKPETNTHPQYTVRRVQLGRTAQLDELAHASGQVYSRTLLFFWRTVRRKGLWLKPKHLMRLIPSDPDHLLNGRLLRSKRQYRNKLIAKLDAKISHCKKGGKRRRKLIRAKQKRLSKLTHQIQDIEHKLTSYLVNTLYREGVEKLVIGDVRTIRHGLDKGSTTNQKLHQWSFGSIRHKLTYKAERLGMRVVVQEEIS